MFASKILLYNGISAIVINHTDLITIFYVLYGNDDGGDVTKKVFPVYLRLGIRVNNRSSKF